jgi:hypothetical protein
VAQVTVTPEKVTPLVDTLEIVGGGGGGGVVVL